MLNFGRVISSQVIWHFGIPFKYNLNEVLPFSQRLNEHL